MADNFGLVKQNFPLGLKGSACSIASLSPTLGDGTPWTLQLSNPIPQPLGWVKSTLWLWVSPLLPFPCSCTCLVMISFLS